MPAGRCLLHEPRASSADDASVADSVSIDADVIARVAARARGRPIVDAVEPGNHAV
ncbi:MAG TPA: hypothetical protein VFT72_07890 [Opitutaceae bacterium]|nr:hypothetical protein [Opitutaceae bacterium]